MNILVTGGASGLGKAIVNRLALHADFKIFFTFANSRNEAEELTKQFQNTTAIHCDFKDSLSVNDLLTKIPEFKIDVLINNAVTSLSKLHFHKAESEDLNISFQQNVIPILQITKECIKVFRNKKFGKIINIASSAILSKPPIGWSEYVANKNYLLSMSKSWATENIRFNITSNSISPAFMKTSLTSDTDERVVEEMINNHPLKKLLTKEEVAESVLFLTTCSQQINGINLVINAGVDIL